MKVIRYGQEMQPCWGFLIGRNSFKDKAKENQLAQFDCGAAWMALSMQARILGYFTHGMGGIDRDIVRDTLARCEEHKVIMGFAVGKRQTPIFCLKNCVSRKSLQLGKV